MKNNKIIPQINAAKSILIVCHVRPDGDTLGSGLALYSLCSALKKPVDIVTDSSIPPQYGFMPNIDAVNNPKSKKYDLAIVVDCADSDRMGKYIGYAKSAFCINIDHHKTNDYFGKINVVVPTASSTCEVVFDILDSENVFDSSFGLDAVTLKKIATCLLTGLSTDTGHFMHSSVNHKVLSVASTLSGFGADIHYIANCIYRSDSKTRLLVLGHALSKLRFFDSEKICLMTLMLRDFEKFNASSSETEGFINYGLGIKSVEVSITITQFNTNVFKVSFRSKGLDVSRVAGVFDGGGHVRASGCTISGHYEDVVDKVIKAVRDFME